MLEVAAYGIDSEFSEEEVAVAVVLRSGATLTGAEPCDYCTGRMGGYMVPEHIRFLDSLPKTPTEKVAKVELKRLHPGAPAS